MKSKKYLSWLLCLSLLCTMLALPSAPVYAEESGKDSGVVLKKTATYNEADKSYTIRLEAYATGSKIISTVTEDVPTDIVLVLDQSGSMADCIVCGQSNSSTHTVYAYKEADTIDNDLQYYIKEGSTYTQVQYCSGSHDIFGYIAECDGRAGWYTSPWMSEHTSDNKITPKDSDHTDGTQFYTRTQRSEKCTKRMDALKSAATGFVNAVAKKAAGKDENVNATDDNVNHRIAVVSYADNASNQTSGFKNMDAAGAADTVNRAINGLNANGGTMINDGISTANDIFASNPLAVGEKRNRIMIVFTDGAPGMYGDWGSKSVNTANQAISNAKAAKQTYGATVYTIGIFSGADASNPNSLPAYTKYTTSFWGEEAPSDADQVKNSNRFMHLVSSNYPNATSITDPGAINSELNGKSYYLSASDSGALNNIFQQISDQIESGGATTELTETSVIKDVVTPYFDLPADSEKVKLYTADSDGGYDKWKDPVAFEGTVTIDKKTSTVGVSGFNFKENWCGEEVKDGTITTFHNGKKLIIEFTVKPKDGFLGGNDVKTNGTKSGIYDKDGNLVDEFVVPTVNVPIKDVTVTAQDKNVYLLGEVTAEQLKNGATVKVGDVTLDLSKATDTEKPYGLETWQTEYVDITVEVKDKDGNVVTDKLENLTNDTTYTVEVTVSPKTDGTGAAGTPATEKPGENTPAAKINVFKPELTFKDSTVEFKKSVLTLNSQNYADIKAYFEANNKVSVPIWKHGNTESTVVTMIGTEPTLDLTYTPEAGKIDNNIVESTTDIPVKVEVKIDTADVTGNTTFEHQPCDSVCGWNSTTMKDGDPAFLLHVINVVGDLKITKTGLDYNVYGGEKDRESAIFEVVSVEEPSKKWTVAINGNSSVTLTGLKVGKYTVRELTDWTWRYDSSTLTSDSATANANGSITVTVTGGDGAVTTVRCENGSHNDKWLGGDNYKNNVFGN